MSGYDQHSLDRLTPSYLASYGLREAPFADTHDDRFFFIEPERAQRLNLLQHMVQYSDLLLMVTGERGSGKTALLQHLVKGLDEQWQICQIEANTMMDADQLLFQISRGFAVQNLPQTSAELQEQLYQRLAGLHERDKIPLLIIDDAHELPQDALEMLFQLADVETAGGKLVRVILFCEPQIETMLNSPAIAALRERITHNMEMPSLSETETAEYIKHRLAVSGFDGTSPFTPKMIKKIYKGSLGQPAKINMLAHELLEKGDVAVADEEDVTFTAEVRRSPETKYFTPLRIVLGSVAIIIIALVLVYQKDINRAFDGKVDQKLLEANLPKPAASTGKDMTTTTLPVPPTPVSPPAVNAPVKEKVIPLKPDAMALDGIEKPAAQEQQKQQDEQPQQAVFAESQPAEQKKAAPANEQAKPESVATAPDLMATTAAAVEKPVIKSIEPQPIIGSHKRQTISILGSGYEQDSRVRLQWGNRKKVLSRDQVILEDTGRLNMLITTGTQPDDWKVTVLNGQQVSNTFTFNVLAPPRDTHSTTDGKKWINKRPADHFTLQLLSVTQLSSVESYIKQHHLDGNDIAIIKTVVRGQYRYVLTKGEYPSHDAAQQAIKALPSAVQKSGPWIRAFKDLQQQLKATGNVATGSKSLAPRSAISLLKADRIPSGMVDQTAWLWSQDPSHYTLQLFGTYQLESLKRFIDQHHLSGKVAAFKSQRSGRGWYVLVYGSYPDRTKAKQAIARLPASLKRSQPWARSFASIHESLHDAGR